MRTNLRSLNAKIWMGTAVISVLLLLASTASAQWSTASPSPNIYYNAGTVGIGTMSPTAVLHIQGSGTGNYRGIQVQDNFTDGTNKGAIAIIGARKTNANVPFAAFGTWDTGTDRMAYVGGGTWSIPDATAIKFYTASTYDEANGGSGNQRMLINSAGNVGIGTASPGRKLEIADGNAGLGTQFRLYHQNGDSGNSTGSTEIEFLHGGNQLATSKMRVLRNFNGIGSSNTDFYLDLVKGNAGDNGNTANTVLFAQGLTGYVGIGTSSPLSRLHLFSGGTIDNVLQNFQNGTRNWTIGINGASDLFRITDQTAGTARLAILNSGNVGIGTTTPGQKLSVLGIVESSSGGFKFPNGSVQTTAVQGDTSITIVAGDGMADGGSLTVGGGGSVTLKNADRGSAQPIFKNIADSGGITRIIAGSNNDTLQVVGSGGTTVTLDGTGSTRRITIGSTSTIAAGNVLPGQFAAGNYTIPGNLTVTGTVEGGNIKAKYQDMAEWVPSSEQLPAGTVVVLDSTKSNQVISSSQAYDTRVAGVISEQPGIALGESGAGKVLVATTGRVLVNVDATKSPIHIGDLLVTSDVPGVAMKSEPVNVGGVQLHRPGTLIGKALEPLEKGSGKILVLLSLQ